MAEPRNPARNEDPQDQSMEEILQSIRRIIAEEGEPSAAAAQAPEPAPPMPAASGSDILELTDIVPDEPAPAHAAPVPQDDVLSSIDAALTATAAAAPPVADPLAVPDEDGILTQKAATASAAAFQHLVQSVSKPDTMPFDNSPRLLNGATTLEQITIEALRPLLKGWLDANLPRLVEKIIDREVRRITRNLTDGQ